MDASGDVVFTAGEIAAATGGEVTRAAAPGSVSTDTRSLLPGQWFLALVGDAHDGNAFARDALAAGCAGMISSRPPPAGWPAGYVRVGDTLDALQALASDVRGRFDGPVVGITGSVGKTTTRALVAAALEASPGSRACTPRAEHEQPRRRAPDPPADAPGHRRVRAGDGHERPRGDRDAREGGAPGGSRRAQRPTGAPRGRGGGVYGDVARARRARCSPTRGRGRVRRERRRRVRARDAHPAGVPRRVLRGGRTRRFGRRDAPTFASSSPPTPRRVGPFAPSPPRRGPPPAAAAALESSVGAAARLWWFRVRCAWR